MTQKTVPFARKCEHRPKGKMYKEALRDMGITVVEEEATDLHMSVVLPDGWKTKWDGGYWTDLLDEQGRSRGMSFEKLAFWDRDAFFCFHKRFHYRSDEREYEEGKYTPLPKFIEDGEELVPMKLDEDDYDVRADDTILILKEERGVRYTVQGDNIIKYVKRPKMVPNPDYVPMTGYEEYSEPFHGEVLDHDKTVLYRTKTVRTDFAHSDARHREFFDHRRALEKQNEDECKAWLDRHYPDWENPLAYWDK